MKNGKRWRTRAAAMVLLLALCSGILGAGVRAQDGLSKQITLAMSPDFAPQEPLVQGDVLRIDVTAQADFPVYSNSTVLYYDKRYFAPCEESGTAFAHAIQGGAELSGRTISEYLAPNMQHPLCSAGTVFGDLNVTNLADYPAAWKDASGALLPAYQNYAAIALKVPYDLLSTPAAGIPDAQTPWFTCFLKAIAPAENGSAAVLMAQEAVRSTENPNAVMYYSAAPGAAGWKDVTVQLPEALGYTIEAAAANPVTAYFTAGEHGSLTGDITQVRNIEQGTSLAAQSALRWPGTQADYGYYFAGWADADDSEQAILPDSTPLGTQEGVYVNEVHLKAVFLPNPVSVQLFLLDLRRPEGQQEIDLGEALPITVATDYSAVVLQLEPVLDTMIDPIDPESGYFLEVFGPAQANHQYIVPEMDSGTLRVEAARVHRGTWFVRYLAGAADVTLAVTRQEKAAGAAVSIAAAPSRRGWTFDGWTDGTRSYKPGESYSADADLTLTALWKKNPDPVVSGSTTLQYKSSTTLQLTSSASGSTNWASSNTDIVKVKKLSDTACEITGAKRGTAVVTATDGEGFPASVTVTVKYVWWQWLIIIFLFGWIWY